MNFDGDDRLELQHLSGGNIVQHPPVFSAQGRFVFVRCGLKVQVFVTSTGELTRELNDATSPLISLELDVKQPELLLGCTSNGQVLRWHWRTGVLQETIDLKLEPKNLQLLTFNLLNLYKEGETACAFVTAKRKSGEQVLWFVVNTSTGTVVDVNCGLKLKVRIPLVDVSKGMFKYIILAQGKYVYFVNYATWDFWRYQNTESTLVTCVCMSPGEAMAATGDTIGHIVIWRYFNKQHRVQMTDYHWHSTGVTSIAFTPTGVSFYSAGHESVLVKWSVTDPEVRNFLPRMSSIIRHIVISEGNEHILACTDDNALQFISPNDMNIMNTLQHFTYELPDKTGRPMFPLGLCLNPRTNTLVLNGRAGHLQFYSAYTRSLLYNLRVVDRNVNSLEQDRVVYNTRITHAAFNINWMVTGETYNDHHNFPELRLKFWQYLNKSQNYALNTNIELPHEHGFRAIVFSNQFKVDDLRCASAGKDNVIKLWTLADSKSIYKRSKLWSCVAQVSYKQLSLGSICFSQDGSLLAAGYASSLVLFDARTLRLLHALSSSAGCDGVLAKAQLRLAQAPVNGTRTELVQQRQQLWNLLQTLLDSNDQKLIEQARQLMASAPSSLSKPSPEQTPKEATKESVYKHIMQMAELSLHQKLQLLRRFSIECTVPKACQRRLWTYLQSCGVDPMAVHVRSVTLEARLTRLRFNERFKAKQRLARFNNRRKNYEQLVRQELLPLFSVLQLDEITKPKAKASIKRKRWESTPAQSLNKAMPFQTLAQISHVQFGAGAQAHLVAVCTESRVLIWNMMTLRLQAGLKLSVKQFAFDPLTNLIAAVTHNDELHVFQPNVPLPVYQRSDMPKLYGLVWLPRRQPKQSSIHVDWQAQSTLHLLTEDKQIVYLAPPGQTQTDDAPAPISFAQPAEDMLQYATFGCFMPKQKTGQNTDIAQGSGPLIVGRGVHSAVNALVNLSAHTMPAMSLICGEFIKSLLTPAESAERQDNATSEKALTNGLVNGNGYASPVPGSDAEDEEENVELRKKLFAENTALEKGNNQEIEQMALDARLRRVAQLGIYLDF